MLVQMATFLVETIASLVVFLLLVRFHFQWLRVPFRNPIGEFTVAATNWAVLPARRVIPGLAGLDLATLLVAWLVQGVSLWAVLAMKGLEPSVLALCATALVQLLRFSIYILIFAIFIEVAISWINPDAPVAPLFQMVTRPFLRPLRRYVPPVGRMDLSPLVLLLILYLLLYPVGALEAAALTL
jgi:YggT family protein